MTRDNQAQVHSPRDGKPIRRTFRSLAEARTWRHESQVGIRKGLLRSPSQTTLTEAATDWLAAAEQGIVRTRSGENYKPSAIRAYKQALNSIRNTVMPLRAIYERAHRRGEVATNPTLKRSLPVDRGRRERVAAPTELGREPRDAASDRHL